MLTREFIFFTQHLGRVQFEQDTKGVADTVKIGNTTKNPKTIKRLGLLSQPHFFIDNSNGKDDS